MAEAAAKTLVAIATEVAADVFFPGRHELVDPGGVGGPVPHGVVVAGVAFAEIGHRLGSRFAEPDPDPNGVLGRGDRGEQLDMALDLAAEVEQDPGRIGRRARERAGGQRLGEPP